MRTSLTLFAITLLTGCSKPSERLSDVGNITGDWFNRDGGEVYSLSITQDVDTISGTGTCRADFGNFCVSVCGSRHGRRIVLHVITPGDMSTNTFTCRLLSGTPTGISTNIPVLWAEGPKMCFMREKDRQITENGFRFFPNQGVTDTVLKRVEPKHRR